MAEKHLPKEFNLPDGRQAAQVSQTKPSNTRNLKSPTIFISTGPTGELSLGVSVAEGGRVAAALHLQQVVSEAAVIILF